MTKKKRLLWQLYPTYLLITVICLVAATWFASRSIKHSFLRQYAGSLETRARLIEQQIFRHFPGMGNKEIDALCKEMGRKASTRITVILPTGEVVGDSDEDPENMDNHRDRPEVIEAMKGQVGLSIRYSNTLNQNMMYVAVPLHDEDRNVGVVRTSIPLTSIDETIQGIQLKIGGGGLLVALFAAILSLWVSRRISRPLEEMREGAEQFAKGNLDHRLPVPDSAEMNGLAQAMNQMAAQLDDRIKAVIRQRNELEAVLSSMVEGVLAVDMDEHVIRMNQAAARTLKCDTAASAGRSLQEVARNTELQQFVKMALHSQALVEKDIVLHTNGERVINALGTILKDENEKRIGALIVLNDVTQLRKLENIRRDFVANVSHEIKTPITAIKGASETLRYGDVEKPEEKKQFLEIINRHVNRLEAIVEDLLSLSRIEEEAERDIISKSQTDIGSVLRSAVRLCQDMAAAKEVTIEMNCDEHLKALVNPLLLEQACVNLLNNAVKYSNPKHVVHIEAGQKNAQLFIRVQDHGVGISKKHLPRLFERFYRVDKARSRKLGGTGLGLAIVKHIVQAHGGSVTVESTVGKGSLFTIHLPQ